MATQDPQMHDGANTTASADLSGKQFYAVKITGSRVVGLTAAAADLTYGILQNKPSSGQACDVAIFGITKAVAGASITAGAKLMANSSGQIITFTTSAGAPCLGYAIETAGATLTVFTMHFFTQAAAFS